MERKAIGPLANYLLLLLSLQCLSDDKREMWQLTSGSGSMRVSSMPTLMIGQVFSFLPPSLSPSRSPLSLSFSPFLYLNIKFHSNTAHVLQY